MPSRLALLGVSGPTTVVVPPSSFTPADIYGLEAWYYQPDLDYAAGTWTDRSGNTRNLTQATAGKRPTLSAALAELNGKYGVTGDGTDDMIESAAFTLNQPTTFVTVGRQVSWVANRYVWDGPTGNQNLLFQNNASPQVNPSAGSTGPAFTRWIVGKFGLLVVVYNAAASLLITDGDADGPSTVGATNAGGLSLFGSGSDANWSNVQFSDVFLYRQQVGAYDLVRLQNEWIAADRYNIPVTFNPLSVGTCALWLRGDDLGAVDSAISSWTDQSGNARHATQGTGANQPLVKIGINGKKVAYFDDGDVLNTASFTLNKPTTIFIVGMEVSGASGGNAYIANVGNNNTLLIWNDGASTIGMMDTSSFNTPGPKGIYHTIAAVFNGASSKLSVDGVMVTGSISSTNVTDGVSIGATGAAYLSGNIAEVIVYSGALTDAVRQQVEGYLANKYAINAAIRPFDPLSIAGCKGWYTGASTDQTSDSGTVATWYDKSGNGHHFTQPTATNRPTYRATDGSNSTPYLDFDGVDNYLEQADHADFSMVAGSSLFVVYRTSQAGTGASAGPLWEHHSTGPGLGYTLRMGMNLTKRWTYYINPDGSKEDAVETADGSWHVSSFVTGSTVTFRHEGVQTFSSSLTTPSDSAGVIRIGYVTGGSAGYFDGEIAELIWYNVTVSAADRASIEAYLEQRYAIAYKAPNHSSLVANLKLWLDASQETGADNSSLSTYTDRSGNAANFVAGTAPTLQTLEYNGRPTARFVSASSQYLTNTSFSVLNSAAAITVFAVVKKAAAGSASLWGGNSGRRFEIYADSAANMQFHIDGSNYGYVTDPLGSTSPHIISEIFDGSQSTNATRLRAWIDGAAKTLSYGGTIPATLPAGTTFDIGRSVDSTLYWGGDIMEVAIFNTTLSNADRRAVENYLSQKWNIAV